MLGHYLFLKDHSFSRATALGKLFASRNRWYPWRNILAYFRAIWKLLLIYTHKCVIFFNHEWKCLRTWNTHFIHQTLTNRYSDILLIVVIQGRGHINMWLSVKMLQKPAKIWLTDESPQPFIHTSIITKPTTFIYFHSFSFSPLLEGKFSQISDAFLCFYSFSCSRFLGAVHVTLKICTWSNWRLR